MFQKEKLNGLFHKAYKFGTNEDKEKLIEASENFKDDLEKNPSLLGQSKAIGNLLSQLEGVKPKTYETVEDFATEKSAKTFGNAAFYGYKKYKDKAPIINIENIFPGMAFAHSKELNRLIKESREHFIEKAKSQGISESLAEEQAEKLIGITLDVGHLNLARKKGYKEEDLLREVKEMSKNIKHVHLTDNFGYGDTHLPPGMGNVPIKQIMEELEKQGYSGAQILEAGGWPQHFGTSPFPYSLEAFGSEMYAGGPYWNQTPGLMEGYSGGFGEMLPQMHYQTFGAGFSQLPKELGGTLGGGAGSRAGGGQ